MMFTVQIKDYLKTPEAAELLYRMYGNREGVFISQIDRYTRVIKRHYEYFPSAGAVRFFSAPGRTEIGGNHTDHNAGRVLAAAVNLDTIAAVSRNDEGIVHLYSEGYPAVHVDLKDLSVQEAEKGKTAALVRGIAARLTELGTPVAGFNATMTSSVLGGSGLSSSASVEVLLCAIMDGLFGAGDMDAKERAKIAQYTENVFFGKPSGLMDQMASSVGGLVTIDFKHASNAQVRPLAYDFASKGYALVVVSPGGSHDDLTDQYAAIRQEMEQVAACFDDKVLRSVRPEQVEANIAMLREKVSDRAILRAMHFFDENQRVTDMVEALERDDLPCFFQKIIESGESSWKLLQNIYAHQDAQPLALALELARRFLQGDGAWRVHGGGFAGTILCFVPNAKLKKFTKMMSAAFNDDHACTVLDIRPVGALEVVMR